MKAFIYFLSVMIIILSGCTPKFTELHGENEDSFLQIEASATYDNNEDVYKVQTVVENISNQDIELNYDCGEIIRYKDRPEEAECINVASETINGTKTKATKISKENFEMNEGKFTIWLVYSLNANGGYERKIKVQLNPKR